DPAFVQYHAADQLHVEMALAERALGSLAHGGEGGYQNVVEGSALRELLLERFGAAAQRLVRERLELRLQCVDRLDARPVAADPPIVGGAEKLAGDCVDHARDPSNHRPGPSARFGKTRGDRRSVGVSGAGRALAGPLQRKFRAPLTEFAIQGHGKTAFSGLLATAGARAKRRRGGRDIGGGSTLVNRRR